MATQAARHDETRRRLLDAAAELFAERGVDSASIDAIAERADRTSGAVYDHFGGKDGLLFALLQSWTDAVAVAAAAEMEAAATLDERIAVLWRAVSAPVAGDGRWITLEHELWSYAARHPEARALLTKRYRNVWRAVSESIADWTGDTDDIGAAVIGLLFGLEMMRLVDPSAVDDELAIRTLRGVIAGTNATLATHATTTDPTPGADRP